jgi:DNA repair protein RecN (Recombination protein N)
MLTCLRVKNLAIIDALELLLGPGLNVVTGETGAGKSILVDAIELVLGARGRPEIIRTGQKQCEVEALFELDGEPEVIARLEAAGFELEDELVVRRVVSAGGRSRAYVNGRLASAAELARLASGLVDISSQHEHTGLVDPTRHLDYLDAFAGLAGPREEAARAYAALSEAARALAALDARMKTRAEREDLLRFQLGEIDAIAPRAGEAEALSEERERLRHAVELARVAGGAEAALYDEDDAVATALTRIANDVRNAARFDPSLERLAKQLDEARAQVEDAARELGAYARDVSLDPDRLEAVEERLDALKRLVRKHGSVEGALAAREDAARELGELDRSGETRATLLAARAEALDVARQVARTLSERRTKAAVKLGRAIAAELASLGMGGARVEVQVERLGARGEGTDATALEIDGARLSPTGIDRAELLIAPNRGEEARPLARIASGGELSRALLAIKRVLAGLSPAGMYVFDEVDSGVGGAVAETIGKKLRDVAKHHQVLCITHLPQIAVFADQHFHVQKDVVGGRTRSAVHALDAAGRLEEIARMLGGLKVTDKTRAAAAELLELARAA